MRLRNIFSAAALTTAATFGLAPMAFAQTPTPGQQPAAPAATTQNIGTVAEAQGFGEWARGMRAAGFEQRLGERPYTVFAAQDAAYQQVPAATREAWRTDPAQQRAAIGHTVVEGRMTLQDLRQRDHVMTVDGQRLPVRVEGDRVWVGDARIDRGDIQAGTGMIHGVDRVLMPQQGQPLQQQQPGMQPGVQQPGQQQPGMQPGQQPAQQPGMQQPMQPGMQQPVRERVRKGGW